METNYEDYIGREFIGFKFKSDNGITFARAMDKQIGKTIEIRLFDKVNKAFKSNTGWWWPAEQVLENIIKDKTEDELFSEALLKLKSIV